MIDLGLGPRHEMRHDERRTEVESDAVEADDVEIDVATASLGVALDRRRQLAQRLAEIAAEQPPEIGQGIAEIARLHVQQRRESPLFEEELARVRLHEGHLFAPARDVAIDPVDRELEHRLGPALRLPIVLDPGVEVTERQRPPPLASREPPRLELRGVDRVHLGKDVDVLREQRSFLLRIFDLLEVEVAG